MTAQKLTAQQLSELADNFTAMSGVIDEFWEAKNKTHELSEKDNEKFSKIQWDLSTVADKLYTLSAILVMDNVASSLATVQEVTTKMQSTYQALKDIQKAIYIATAVVTLSAAIIKVNPQAIGSAIEGLADCFKTE